MKRVWSLFLLSITVALTPSNAPSCGPSFPEPLFTTSRLPDVPDADFQAGKLGVITGDLDPEYLIVAYRYLQGIPLTGKAARTPVPVETTPPPSAVDLWTQARNAVAPPKQDGWLNPYRTRRGSEYVNFPNCLDDAFKVAVETLQSRAKTFGPKHAGVQAWIAAQDVVFANCGEGEGTPAVPEKSLPPVLAADRRYQIAAAHFYAMRYSEARARFQQIAAEKDSPWRFVAPYLAARTYIREGLQGEKPDSASLQTAEKALNDLAAKSPDPGVRNASRRLVDFVGVRLHPSEQVAAIGNKLADPKLDEDFRTNVASFAYLERAMADALKPGNGSDLTDWVFAMQGRLDAAEINARWAKTKSETWLIPALKSKDPVLIEAAAKVKPTSPAYPTAAFHMLEMRKGSLSPDKMRVFLDQILTNLQDRPRTIQNVFRHERLLVAKDYSEFLKFAPRYPAAVTDDTNPGANEWPKEYPDTLLENDSTDVLNDMMPASAVQQAAVESSWTDHLRTRALRAAWTRAVLIEDFATAQKLTPALVKAHPETRAWMEAFAQEKDPAAQKFAAVYAILKTPVMSPTLRPQLDRMGSVIETDGLRDNWWCGSPVTDPDKKPTPKPTWLPPESTRKADAEWNRILEPGAAGNYFAPIVIDWAQSHKIDPRSPEALHLVVESTRIGCRDGRTGASSKRAHTTLHRLFPDSPWAKKTKYWYAQ